MNVTPFEPEWEGHVTLEISNTTPLSAIDRVPDAEKSAIETGQIRFLDQFAVIHSTPAWHDNAHRQDRCRPDQGVLYPSQKLVNLF